MDIISAIKIEEIYRNNLKSCQEIAKYLGIWDNLSEEEQQNLIASDRTLFEKKFSHLSEEEIKSNLNDSKFWEEYNDEFVYGEITKSGVNKLSEHLKDYRGVFYDIGSGNGKLLLHLSFITNFDKLKGVELVELRHKYALKINETVKQNVEFICADVLTIDISDANFIFIDDLMFPEDLRIKIINKIPKDCFYISVYKNEKDKLIKELYLSVSWLDGDMPFYLYKKE